VASRRFGASVLHDVLRLAVAGGALAAITYQIASLEDHGVFRAANFFSFFTIQTNLLAIGLLAACVLVRRSDRGPGFDAVRGAITLYITITGVVFALLLSGLQEELQTHVAWVDFVVHRLMPVVVLADWLLDPPRHRIAPRVALLWLVYPLAYFVYSLIRGEVVDWYPYPFLDASELGYGGVLWRVALISAGVVAAALAVAEIGNRLGRRRDYVTR
jgi:hypothetical protein